MNNKSFVTNVICCLIRRISLQKLREKNIQLGISQKKKNGKKYIWRDEHESSSIYIESMTHRQAVAISFQCWTPWNVKKELYMRNEEKKTVKFLTKTESMCTLSYIADED